MRERLRVGVVFGGRSGEHEVSLASAYSVMTALDPSRYEVVPIGIDKAGRWLVGADAWPRLRREAKLELGPGEEDHQVPRAVLPADSVKDNALVNPADGQLETTPSGWVSALDVIFPVLHGPYGEDGTVQGLLELADVPYVGAGVAGSAVAMDKLLCRQVLAANGIPQVRYLGVLRSEWEGDPESVRERVAELGYPCFAKPANLGSSVGITKVHGPEELDDCLNEAARFDRRIIVEEAVPNPREIELSVLGNDQPIASVPGEVIPCHEFYDYEAKYLAGDSEIRIPAELPEHLVTQLQSLAVQAYQAMDLAGLARVDFLLGPDDSIYLNEANTIPGFTPISMYPKMWEASGLPYPELLDKLLELAMERHRDKQRSATSI